MKISDKIRKQAAELAEKHNLSNLFVNNKGEFFTEVCHAANSVGGDKKKYAQVPLNIAVADEKSTTDLETAKEVIEKIEASDDIQSVKAILTAELEGKKRKSVLQAADQKIKSLTVVPGDNTEDKPSDDAGKLDETTKADSEPSKTDE